MNHIQRFTKKPVTIEAVQWDGTLNTAREIISWIIDDVRYIPKENAIEILTLEGVMRADVGDWIIKGVKGEFYPCKPDIFKETYDRVVL